MCGAVRTLENTTVGDAPRCVSYTRDSGGKCIIPNYEGGLITFHSQDIRVTVLPTLGAPNPELHQKNSVWWAEEVSRKLCHLTLALICKKVVFQNRRWGWKSKYSCVFSTPQWERRGPFGMQEAESLLGAHSEPVESPIISFMANSG